jgi:tRNA (guanine37-N1)-methyltransferase
MVMRADVLGRALSDISLRRPPCPIIYMSPRGRPLTQARAQALADGPGAMVLCGRFEGIDQRVIDHFQIEEISIGDYVLSGGELAAQVMLDAAVRLIPGVLGQPSQHRTRELFQRPAGTPAIHPPTNLGRTRNPARVDIGRSWQGGTVAG